MSKTKTLLLYAAISLSNGCVNSPDDSPKGLVGKWVGESPQKKGTMCKEDYLNTCYRKIPWIRKDVNSFVFNADSSGTNTFHYIRINEKDSSESWIRLDSLTYSIQADSIIINIFKYKYEHDSIYRLSNEVQKYKHRFINGDLILNNYEMWDTAMVWTVDFKLIKSN